MYLSAREPQPFSAPRGCLVWNRQAPAPFCKLLRQEKPNGRITGVQGEPIRDRDTHREGVC